MHPAAGDLPGDRIPVLDRARPGGRQIELALAWVPTEHGTEPEARDGCGLPTASGAPVQPDVVLVPCVGFTEDGYRLGYGGGFFDRYLDAHPDTTAVGVAWSVGRMPREAFTPAAHDRPLMLVVTENGVVG